MVWSGGVYSRSNGPTGWQTDAAGGIGIEAGLHDIQDNDLAGGINNTLTKDGQNTATANLPMGGFKHTNVANGTAVTDYASLGQVQNGTSQVVVGGVLGGTANAYTASLSPAFTALTLGMVVRFQTNLPNTGASTININGLGAKSIKKGGLNALSAAIPLTGNELFNNSAFQEIVYNGTDFILLNADSGKTSWTPTFTTQAGSLSSITSAGTYSVSEHGIVTFELGFGVTFSATSNYLDFTVPLIMDNQNLGYIARLTSASTTILPADPSSTTTIRITHPSSFAAGASTFKINGNYRAA